MFPGVNVIIKTYTIRKGTYHCVYSIKSRCHATQWILCLPNEAKLLKSGILGP